MTRDYTVINTATCRHCQRLLHYWLRKLTTGLPPCWCNAPCWCFSNTVLAHTSNIWLQAPEEGAPEIMAPSLTEAKGGEVAAITSQDEWKQALKSPVVSSVTCLTSRCTARLQSCMRLA